MKMSVCVRVSVCVCVGERIRLGKTAVPIATRPSLFKKVLATETCWCTENREIWRNPRMTEVMMRSHEEDEGDKLV